MHVNPPHETATAGSPTWRSPRFPRRAATAAGRRMWRGVLLLWSLSLLYGTVGVGLLVTSQLAGHWHVESWQTQPWQALTGWDSVYYIDIGHVGHPPGSQLGRRLLPAVPAADLDRPCGCRSAGDAIAALSVSRVWTLLAAMGRP